MSERQYRLYLNDILESGHAIQLYVEGITYDIFCKERMRLSAVIREFEIIGEAVGKLPETIKEKYPDVPWREIKDFRNLLIHEYFGVDLQIIWNTIQLDLPLLLKASESALAEDPSVY